MSTESLPPETIEMSTDEQLIPFLSTKFNDVLASWMQSNYTDLFSNYEAIFNAYNQLKSDYDTLKEDNALKQDQIERLTLQINSSSPSPQTQMPRNSEDSNGRVNALKDRIKTLENELVSTQTTLKHNLSTSTKEMTTYQHQIQDLTLENKRLRFKSDLNTQSVENQTSLKEMDHQQTKQKYDEWTQYHANSMKSIHSFLYQMHHRCQLFLNQYSQNDNHGTISNHSLSPNPGTDVLLMRDIKPKLTTSFANLEQFLYDMKMVILSKETEHVTHVSDMEEFMSGDDT